VSELWTYRLEDFMLFSERVYRRLFEVQNETWWPLQILLLCFGLLLALSLLRPIGILAGFRKPGWMALGTIWLFVAITFLQTLYAQINPLAQYGAWAFVVQAFGLAALATGSAHGARASLARTRTGMAFIVAGLVVYPIWGMWRDGAPVHAEWFGLMPDPTALATIGFILLAGPIRVVTSLLLVVPVTWSALSFLTLLAMFQRELTATLDVAVVQ